MYLVQVKELSAWLPCTPVGQSASSADVDLVLTKDDTARGLRRLLLHESHLDMHALAINAKQKKNNVRRANQAVLISVDWSLQRMNGWGLDVFIPKKMTCGVPLGGRRYFTKQQCPLSGADRQRACIETLEKERYFEVGCRVEDGAHIRPTLHLSQDQGAASWHGSVWMMNALGVRGTLSWDRCHRHQNDIAEAATSSGLVLLKLEMSSVLGLRRGPFGKERNHEVLITAAKEMFVLLNSQSLLFSLFYENVCADLDEHAADKGSVQDYERVWRLCEHHLVHATTGSAPKSSRWWSVERLAREQRKLRAMFLMLLIYVGFRRGWWSTYKDVPLFLKDAELKPEADPEAIGLEALEKEDGKEEKEKEDAADEDMVMEPALKKLGVAKSREELRRKRQQCVGAMQYATRTLCNKKNVLLFDGMEYLTRPWSILLRRRCGRSKQDKARGN